MGHVTRFRLLIIPLVVLGLLHQYAPPVAASGNCNIAFLILNGPSGPIAQFCYGNNISYGDEDVSSENQAGLLGPLSNGTYLNDWDTFNGSSGTTQATWWQRQTMEFRFCLWDSTGQPDAPALVDKNTKTGYTTITNLKWVSSIKIQSNTFTCSNHPD